MRLVSCVVQTGSTDVANESISDQLLRGDNPLLGDTSQVSQPLALPDSVPIIDNVGTADGPPSTHIRPLTVKYGGRYRPLPTKKLPPESVLGLNKRKHSAGLHPVPHLEDVGSEDDNPGSCSGDRSSSGESISSNPPRRAKRQRTSRVTRSSIRLPVPDLGMSLASPAPAVAVQQPLVVSDPTLLSPADVPTADTPTPESDTPVPADAKSMPAVVSDADIPLVTGARMLPPDDASTTVADPAIGATSSTAITTTIVPNSPSPPALSNDIIPSDSPSSPASPNVIEAGVVPDFLLRHGKGRRMVNIYQYLNEVRDARFRQVLFHYINFEVFNDSGKGGSLPTAGRPAKIALWSSKARPEGLPDYTKGGRSFSDFVDSIFTWWATIQPPWRSFERTKVSRAVKGGWGSLLAPRINGILNVVMLVYWWFKILEEENPEGSIRTDYELFADDVAWVFSNLCT
jgi:hypothetical protein